RLSHRPVRVTRGRLAVAHAPAASRDQGWTRASLPSTAARAPEYAPQPRRCRVLERSSNEPSVLTVATLCKNSAEADHCQSDARRDSGRGGPAARGAPTGVTARLAQRGELLALGRSS